ncbi:hypothetical protein BH20ACT4_BH20ACT4_12810 [soil metagenome]
MDPWGDLHAAGGRGLFTGNRGCLVNDAGDVVRHHHGNLWITCVTEFRDWKSPLAAPNRWTPIFFLDDAVALAGRPPPLRAASARRTGEGAHAPHVGGGVGSRLSTRAARERRGLKGRRWHTGQ